MKRLILFVWSVQIWAQDTQVMPPLTQAVEQEWSFDPLSKRDPFVPAEIGSTNDVAEIFKWDIGEMSLVAVISGMGPTRAMVMFPNGMSAIIREGETVGRRRGKVVSIASNEVLVKNKLRDNRNKDYFVDDKLVIAK